MYFSKTVNFLLLFTSILHPPFRKLSIIGLNSFLVHLDLSPLSIHLFQNLQPYASSSSVYLLFKSPLFTSLLQTIHLSPFTSFQNLHLFAFFRSISCFISYLFPLSQIFNYMFFFSLSLTLSFYRLSDLFLSFTFFSNLLLYTLQTPSPSIHLLLEFSTYTSSITFTDNNGVAS